MLDQLGSYGRRDECSTAYSAGQWTGTVAGFAAGGKGLLNLTKGAAKGVGRVFWSSGRNPAVEIAAREFAVKNGMTTLGMTNLGKTLDVLTKATSYKFTKPLWNMASKNFAKGAEGTVHVFQNSSKISRSSIWGTVEYPVLKSKGVNTIYHLVE